MGFLQTLYRSSDPVDPRDVVRRSYNEHRFHSPLPPGTSPHRAGLYGALRASYIARGQSVSEMSLWAELAPFLLMQESTACEVLVEYVIYQETPTQACSSWLTKILSASLRPFVRAQDYPPTMIPLALIMNVGWYNLLEADVKQAIEREIEELRNCA